MTAKKTKPGSKTKKVLRDLPARRDARGGLLVSTLGGQIPAVQKLQDGTLIEHDR